MEDKKKRIAEAGVLAVIGAAAMVCLLLSDDFGFPNYQVYRDHYGTYANARMVLEVVGIICVVGLVIWLARRYPRLPPRLERPGWLWIWGLNGIVSAVLGGMILYILAFVGWMFYDGEREALRHGIDLQMPELSNFTSVGFFLFGLFFLVASGLCWRNFIQTWKKPKVGTEPPHVSKDEDQDQANNIPSIQNSS